MNKRVTRSSSSGTQKRVDQRVPRFYTPNSRPLSAAVSTTLQLVRYLSTENFETEDWLTVSPVRHAVFVCGMQEYLPLILQTRAELGLSN